MGFSIDEAEERMLPWYKRVLGLVGLADMGEKDSMVFGITLTATLFFMTGLYRMLLVLLISVLVTLLLTGRFNPLFKALFGRKRENGQSPGEDP